MEIPLEGHRGRDHPCVRKAAVHLHFEALIQREYYRDCDKWIWGADNYCNLVESSDLGFQSDRLHSTHSPDMISLLAAEGPTERRLSAGTETLLLRSSNLPTAQSPECLGIRCVLPLFDAYVWLVESGSARGGSLLPGCRARKRMRGHTEREDQLGSEGCIFGREAKGSRKFQRVNRERSDRPNLYISSFIPLESLVLKTHFLPLMPNSVLSMLTVNMNCVEFLTPTPYPP